MQGRTVVCMAVLACSIGVGGCDGSGASPLAAPNIVLVYVDDMGWRDLGVQGSRYYETPHIDRLAAEGMRFTQAYANAPNCAPSRAALLSGRYAPYTGVYTVASAARGRAADRRWIPVENRTTLALEVVTIAEALAEAGYTSAHIGKWHLGGDGYLAADQGFDWSVAGNEAGGPPSYHYPYVRGGRSIPGLEDGVDGEYLADRLVDESIRFLEGVGDDPFFLHLSHFSVHTPIEGRADLVDHYRNKPPVDGHGDPEYAAMIGAVDEGVGRLLAALDRLGLADNTVVIFTSDNGGFGPVTSMAPLRGSKGMLYEGGIREPLIVRWPGRIEPGAVDGSPVIGLDLFPTILEIAGLETAAGLDLDGVSLVPILDGSGSEGERDLFWHFPAYLESDASVPGPWRTTPVSAIRRGPYKLLYFFEDAHHELYDLASDPFELTDLADIRPELRDLLDGALRDWWVQTGAFLPLEPNPDYRSGADR